MDRVRSDFILLEYNLKRFIEACKVAQNQKTTKGLKLRVIQGIFNGFKLHPSFGSGNLSKRPGLAFLKDENTVNKGIFPIIVYIPDRNEIITCKGVSYDNKPNMNWERITSKDIPFGETPYSDEKGQLSFFRNAYSLDILSKNETVKEIQNDILNIIEDYPKKN